jgi:serine protease Do
MIRFIASTLLVAGFISPACPAQPEEQFNSGPEVYSFSEGSRSYLGVDIQDITADRVGPLKLKEERGVEVTMVDQDAPAGKAGVKEHDVILEFNGTPVESEEQLRRLIRETPPGRSVTLGISRDGSPLKINVQLADRGKSVSEAMPKVFALPRVREIPKIEIPGYTFQVQTYSPTLGIQTESLNQQLAEFFGVKEGVLVRSVEKGSAAEKAGLKAGDVIVRADNERLTERSDLSRILRNHRDGGKLSLGIVRDKHEQTVMVDLPPRNPRDSFWHDFSSDDVESDWIELQSEMRNMVDKLRPEIEHAQLVTSAEVRSALEKAQQESKPAIDKAMRQAQSHLHRAQRMLEQRKRELQDKLHTMI